jgi:DNA/RNA-binding domain of Phe-tRNA-synthetase-like protein
MDVTQVDVDAAVQVLRPDFAAIALLVSGIRNAPTDAASEALLAAAEAAARGGPIAGSHAHLAAWQEAYRSFGAKPQRTPSSVEALWQRALKGGLPRVNWLVDLYNSVSVAHVLPVGGEDASRFIGPLRLIRAAGHEPFDTTKDGAAVTEQPAPGEVVWADEAGVTCRRWNWRQGTRTRLTDDSTEVLFLLERLEPLPLPALEAAGEDLVARLRARYPQAAVARRWLGSAGEALRAG